MVDSSPTFSGILPPRREVRLPSDLLPERRALARRSVSGRAFTIKQLTQHAERFGTEGVVETGAELGYDLGALVRLQDACDRLDADQYRRRHPHARPPRLSPSEARVRLLLGEPKEVATSAS